jgi:hypothetical protein
LQGSHKKPSRHNLQYRMGCQAGFEPSALITKFLSLLNLLFFSILSPILKFISTVSPLSAPTPLHSYIFLSTIFLPPPIFMFVPSHFKNSLLLYISFFPPSYHITSFSVFTPPLFFLPYHIPTSSILSSVLSPPLLSFPIISLPPPSFYPPLLSLPYHIPSSSIIS